MEQNRASTGKIIFWLLLVVFLWLGISHFTETKHILDVLLSGKWYWIAGSILLQLLFYPVYASFLQTALRVFDIHCKQKRLLPIYIASKFTDVALPIAFLGKIALFIRNRGKNVQILDMGLAMFFVYYLEVAAFSIFALIVFLILVIAGKPLTFIYISLLILLLIVSLVTLLLIRTAIFKKPLNHPIRWVIKVIAKLFRQGNIDLDQIAKISLEVGSKLENNNKLILPSFERIFWSQLINLITFAFVYLAFANRLSMLGILAGYVSGLLFTIISITPQGVGVAEAVMITTLHSFGIDISEAAVITLAYRGILYWLPLFPGFYFFSHLELRK
jgi:uncharacterized protein (TIRG00374 family)